MMISILIFVNGETGRTVPVLNEDGNIISDIRHGKAVDLASGSEVFVFK
jgi:hypothetical protein